MLWLPHPHLERQEWANCGRQASRRRVLTRRRFCGYSSGKSGQVWARTFAIHAGPGQWETSSRVGGAAVIHSGRPTLPVVARAECSQQMVAAHCAAFRMWQRFGADADVLSK